MNSTPDKPIINNPTDDLRLKAVEQLKGATPAPVEKNTFTFSELYKNRHVPQQFLIDDLIPDGEVFVIIGEDGIGKTQIMSQLALSIGMKKNHFLGLNLNAKHGNALIVATEDSKKKFTLAITKIFDGIDSKFNPDNVGVQFTEGSNFDEFQSLVDEIENHLKLKHHDLVIVDALLDTFTMIDGEVNSNSHASKILSKFQNLCNTYSCALGVVHHAAKTKITEKHKEGKLFLVKNDSLGAGRITSKARTVLALTHDYKSISQESTTYINYLHAVKINLQSRHYMKNAIKCTFDTSTLLHDADGMVDIQAYEASEIDSPERTAKKPMAKEITIDQHKLNANRAFAEHLSLNRKDLINKLKRYYGVGGNKIEENGGYLQYLLDQGLIVNNNGIFRKGEKEDFKMPISESFDDDMMEPYDFGLTNDFDPAAQADDEESPF